MDAEIESALAPLRDRPYIVFHDAYQYFEARYGLTPVGAFAVNLERKPGARHLARLRKTLKANAVRCIFTEPQFEPRQISAVTGGADIRIAELDPLGATLEPGPELYMTLLRDNAAALRDCLAKN